MPDRAHTERFHSPEAHGVIAAELVACTLGQRNPDRVSAYLLRTDPASRPRRQRLAAWLGLPDNHLRVSYAELRAR